MIHSDPNIRGVEYQNFAGRLTETGLQRKVDAAVRTISTRIDAIKASKALERLSWEPPTYSFVRCGLDAAGLKCLMPGIRELRQQPRYSKRSNRVGFQRARPAPLSRLLRRIKCRMDWIIRSLVISELVIIALLLFQCVPVEDSWSLQLGTICAQCMPFSVSA
jgi:hypothetical protein